MPTAEPYADYRTTADIKLDHMPNAPDLLRRIGASGKETRSFIEVKDGYSEGGQLCVTLCSTSSVLDARATCLQYSGSEGIGSGRGNALL